MNQVRELICIVCPKGCRLIVNDNLEVSGHSCPRGIVYGKAELLNPTRLVSTTIRLKSKWLTRLPVVTSGEIPKARIFDVMNEVAKIEVVAPIKLRQVLIKNVLGLGVDIIATRSIIE